MPALGPSAPSAHQTCSGVRGHAGMRPTAGEGILRPVGQCQGAVRTTAPPPHSPYPGHEAGAVGGRHRLIDLRFACERGDSREGDRVPQEHSVCLLPLPLLEVGQGAAEGVGAGQGLLC